MKIGTGNNNALPGCQPTPDSEPSVPPPIPPPIPPPLNMPNPSLAEGRSNGRNFLVVVAMLVIVVTGVLLFIGNGNMGAGFDVVRKKVLQLAAPYLPGKGAVATNSTVALTPLQQKLVSDYSPAKPINEAKRVKAIAGSRVGSTEDGDTNSAAIAAAVPVTSVIPLQPPPAPEVSTESRRPPAPETGKPGVSAAATKPVKPTIWPAIKISAAIAPQNAKAFARVNGRLVSVGDIVDTMTVTAINSQYVTLSCNGQQRDFYVGTNR